ncbi:MAG: class I SAM-dependent methyltransferase [Mycobacteriales bacterium]
MTDWSAYLAGYHEERPGITEDLLSLAHSAGVTPYAWAAEAVPSSARVLDVCCGSAPLGPLVRSERYLGVDLSLAELARASAQGLTVARADAARLPVITAAVDCVVMSMALQLVPFAVSLDEIARVLRPGGTVVVIVPASRPLSPADRLRYGRLAVALRSTLSYPNDDQLDGFAGTPDLRVVSDESRAFVVSVDTDARADLLLEALYLPGVSEERLAAGRRVVRTWVGKQVAVPIRRLVLVSRA